MNKLLLLAFFTFLSITVFAQAKFEPGYYIDNQGNRVECLIKNTNRNLNPTFITYKLTKDSDAVTAVIDSVRSFEIYNTAYNYQRFSVNIDRSSENLKELSTVKDPEFKQEQLFLKVLIEGNASLYSYHERSGVVRYFYKKDSITPEQLVYKKYLVDDSKFKENKSYKQQLYTNLNCSTLSMEQFDNIEYNDKDLVKLFIRYNECINVAYTNHAVLKSQKGELNFKVKVGTDYVAMEIHKNTGSKYSHTFNSKFSPKVGIEAEYFIPFKENQLAVLIAPAYQHYRNDHPASIYGRDATLEVNYSHITLPVGLRQYFRLSDASKLFVNVGYSFNFLVDKSNAIEINDSNVNAGFEHDKSLFTSAIVGFGYSYKNTYSIEASFITGRTISESKYWGTGFSNSISLTIGYKLFN